MNAEMLAATMISLHRLHYCYSVVVNILQYTAMYCNAPAAHVAEVVETQKWKARNA